ncbi:HD domain-containing protein [Balneola vulgaris]|uniref:HD domain-containing protein n=1 Tax=Balneola vulgaris TaxID=287535 RepID=UPI0003644D6E|nr:HD domain-containing protein [Balneola vulgaris]
MPELKNSEVIERTVTYVKGKLSDEGSGHDWWHVYRVWKMAKTIAIKYSCNLLVVELAALLHDIADHKFHNGDTSIGPKVAKEWLSSLKVPEEIQEHVAQIIQDLSFKGAHVKTPMQSIEGEIVQDADRLDAIGAIGIARAFAYGGHASRELYNPEVPPSLHDSFDAYKNDKGHTINHFYEKLFLLKDRLNTDVAKEIAVERHQFMKEYVDRFLQEWEGEL